jgi:FlaA1/EpsC-like NDP-sugar epimerase
MKKFYENKTILVTGGCGSIGRTIVAQLLGMDAKEVRIYDNSELGLFKIETLYNGDKRVKCIHGDVRDQSQLRQWLNGVDYVFHAAALKHVPLCEYNPFEAAKTNIIGTQNVIEASLAAGIKVMINISTDKAIDPVNTLGATKLIGERLTLSASLRPGTTKFACVRFGNVLNSDGSAIPIFLSQIQKGGPVTITHEDMTRFFMSLQDAVRLVLKAASITEGREIYILKMDSVKIPDLAGAMIELLAAKYGYKTEQIKLKTIGLRPGERITESLISEDEIPFAHEVDDMYVIRPQIYTPHFTEDRPKNLPDTKNLHSETANVLSKEEVKDMLKKNGIVYCEYDYQQTKITGDTGHAAHHGA